MEHEDGLQYVNFVQVAAGRPQIYTANGTLAEIYALLIGYDTAIKRPGNKGDKSVSLTLAWLYENANDRRNVVTEMLDRYGSDEKALQVIYDYASTLPPAPHT